jgi:threonyl-tRNA synthetase
VERFFGILVEHYAGAFPTWLAPVQALIVPIADRHHGYAAEVAGALETAGIRVEIDDSSETLGNRIRKAQASKVPHVLVIGDKEVDARTVSARSRSGEERRGLPVDDFLQEIVQEVAERRLPE